MAFLSVGMRGLDLAQRAIEKVNRSAESGIRRAINITALKIQSKARENLTNSGAIDTGNLRQKVVVRFRNGGTAASIEAQALYGGFVESGAKFTTMPPPSALADWVRRHGMPPSAAFAIAKAIKARGGLKARPFLVPAWSEEAPLLPDRMVEEIRKDIAS